MILILASLKLHVLYYDPQYPAIGEEEEDASQPETRNESGIAQEFELEALLQPEGLARDP